jgi:hypothetical protein
VTPPPRVFELRTYHATPGRLDALQDRIRDHTLPLFARHGFTVIGFWTPIDAHGQPAGQLVYLLAFEDRAAAGRAWAAFEQDPAWRSALAESEHDGPLATIDSVYMTPTQYSALS